MKRNREGENMGNVREGEAGKENPKAVRMCAECPTCRRTRGSKEETLLYRLSRAIQKVCPICRAANRALGKNFQESKTK
jgi:hypothetical protein